MNSSSGGIVHIYQIYCTFVGALLCSYKKIGAVLESNNDSDSDNK